MIRNKYYTMRNCKRCDNEGIVSKCCGTELKFISNGSTKCSKCKKFCKIDYCPDCKEEESSFIIPNQNFPRPIYEREQGCKTKQKNQKPQTLNTIFIITLVIILNLIVLYVALVKK
tara:strand:- start:1361 stop:1708 length:348 start_codon:yes stop_codon:yes gene_type:complete